MADEIIVLITASTSAEADALGRALVEDQLAACVNIIPEVISFFRWEGKTQNERELLLICKSRLPLMPALVDRVKSLHSYSIPEIIALPIVGGSGDYLAWLNSATKA